MSGIGLLDDETMADCLPGRLRGAVSVEGERMAALNQMRRERDIAIVRNRLLEATVAGAHRARLEAQERETALAAENAELRSLVAEFTGLLGSIMDNHPAPSAARVSAHNPFNVPLRDPRRMGP